MSGGGDVVSKEGGGGEKVGGRRDKEDSGPFKAQQRMTVLPRSSSDITQGHDDVTDCGALFCHAVTTSVSSSSGLTSLQTDVGTAS